jgi:Tol biopolymer transport system component
MKWVIALATIACSVAFLPQASQSATLTLGNGCCPNVWSIKPSGRDRRLAFNAAAHDWLVFDLSPDRRRVVFLQCPSLEDTCFDGTLYTAATDGTHRRLLVANINVIAAHWSPNGKRILFADCCGSLEVVGANGAGLRTIVTCGYCTNGIWAPDSRHIAYVESYDKSLGAWGALKIRDLDGAGQSTVTEDVFTDRIDLSWSPNGRWLTYETRDADGHNRTLRVVRPDGSHDHSVGSLAETATPEAWSPDSQRLAFIGPRGLLTVHVDGRHRRRLDRFGPLSYPCCGPAWSPDGRSVAYYRPNAGCSCGTLSVIGAEGRPMPKRLTRAGYVQAIFWTRDGRRLLYADL